MALVKCPECAQQVSTEAVSCPHCGKVLSVGAAVASGGPGGVVFPAASSPPVAEQPLWEGRPSAALVYGKVLRLIIRAVVLFAIGYFVINVGLPAAASISADVRLFVEENSETIKWITIALLGIALVPPVIALPLAVAQLKSTHYKVTNQRILIEQGVISKSLIEIDMRSVDDTEFHQTFLERIFGIGEVWVVSTDKIAPKMVLHGIHDPRKTRELIRANAYQASQRQLFTRST
jgi:membrane protein YdbS with pleckstrin-like domain